jgi:hypothetical protein
MITSVNKCSEGPKDRTCEELHIKIGVKIDES